MSLSIWAVILTLAVLTILGTAVIAVAEDRSELRVTGVANETDLAAQATKVFGGAPNGTAPATFRRRCRISSSARYVRR
jgi:hypothetical protein